MAIHDALVDARLQVYGYPPLDWNQRRAWFDSILRVALQLVARIQINSPAASSRSAKTETRLMPPGISPPRHPARTIIPEHDRNRVIEQMNHPAFADIEGECVLNHGPRTSSNGFDSELCNESVKTTLPLAQGMFESFTNTDMLGADSGFANSFISDQLWFGYDVNNNLFDDSLST